MKNLYSVFLFIALVFLVDLSMTDKSLAQDPGAAIQAQAATAAIPSSGSGLVAPSPVPAMVAIPEPAAPPSWATDLLMQVSKLPVIGPYVSKALLYLGILAAILTSLMCAALTIIASLQKGFNAAGLDNASKAVMTFKNGKFMYWLAYFSNFNAQKPSA